MATCGSNMNTIIVNKFKYLGYKNGNYELTLDGQHHFACC